MAKLWNLLQCTEKKEEAEEEKEEREEEMISGKQGWEEDGT